MVRPDTRDCLLKRKRASLRRLARELAIPAGVLSDVINERHDHVSLRSENRLRARLGLEPISIYEVPACPDCGLVHTGRCNGLGDRGETVVIDPERNAVIDTARQRAVTIGQRKRHKTYPVEWEWANEARKRRGLKWREVWHMIAEILGEAVEDGGGDPQGQARQSEE